MRTVDRAIWYTNMKETRSARKLFGIQSSTAFEGRLRASFTAAMTDLWENCSIESVKYMRERKMSRNARLCYTALSLSLALFGLVSLYSSWAGSRSVPQLIVSLVSAHHPIAEVDFPAVALCSNNVISKRALEKYASYLYSLDVNRTYSLADIERKLAWFGALATWSGAPVDVAFMDYLARVGRQTNVTDVVVTLTPQCTSFLIRCAWRMVRMPCGRLFALRATPHGYCCVFNSRYQDEDLNTPARRLYTADQEAGLSLAVRSDDSDVAYTRGRVEGVQVLLFDGSEYPLIEGGSSKVYLTQVNTSVFLKLSSKVQLMAPYLQYYSKEWRGCHIRHARSRVIDDRSHAWCLANCRRRAVQALCGCVPHLLFPRPGDTVCSLDQLACLNKHKEKFVNFYPGDSADPSLNEESSDSMFCDHCAPDCSRLLYSAAVSHVHYQHTSKLFLNYFISGLSLTNTTVLRIFYASEEQQLYIVESNWRWFEIAGLLCSQWLCVVAVTGVGVAELVYYSTIRWRYHYVKRLLTSPRYMPDVTQTTC